MATDGGGGGSDGGGVSAGAAAGWRQCGENPVDLAEGAGHANTAKVLRRAGPAERHARPRPPGMGQAGGTARHGMD